MTALEDRRPVAATTTASDNPSVIGEDLAHLLVEHPDIELASVRLILNEDGTVGIAGRIGQLTAAGPVVDLAGHLRDAVDRAREHRLGHLVASEAFVDQDDPRYQPNPEAR